MPRKFSRLFLITAVITLFLTAILIGGSDKPTRQTYFNIKQAPKYAIPIEHGPLGGINKESAPALSLGLIPTSSPGIMVGETTYDLQHIGSMGRQIAFHPFNNMVHFVWMSQTDYSIPGDRNIRYQAYDTEDSPPGYIMVAGEIKTVDYSGYVSIDVTGSYFGPTFFACHTDSAGDPRHNWTVVYRDYFPGLGLFSEIYLKPDSLADWYFEDAFGNPLETIWPQIEVHDGTEEVVYVLSHVMQGSDDLIMYRKVIDGIADWDNGRRLETVTNLGYLIVANQGSDSVAIVYTDDRVGEDEGSGGQTDLDVWYMLSENQGADWNAPICVTNYTEDSLWRAFTDLAAVYADDGTLHILWNARELYDSINYYDYRCRLMHWDWTNGSSIVTEARYDLIYACHPGTWDMNIAKMSISQCDGNLYALWTQFGYPNDEAALSDCSQGGFANGELFLCGSDDNGLTWDQPQNLTQTRTPDCDSNLCDSDHWSSMVRYGMVYDGAPDTLDILYINDKDAGGIPLGEGTWCVNPVMHLRIPCRTIDHLPRTSFEPVSYNDSTHTLPGTQLDTTLTIFNLGNTALNWTATIEYENGSNWIDMSAMSGSIPPSPSTNWTTINVSLNDNGTLSSDPSIWEADIIITSAASTSPDTLPVHLTVTTNYKYIRVGDVDTSGQITVLDAISIVRFICEGLPYDGPLALGDVNNDCQVDITDASHLLAYIFFTLENRPELATDTCNQTSVVSGGCKSSLDSSYTDPAIIVCPAGDHPFHVYLRNQYGEPVGWEAATIEFVGCNDNEPCAGSSKTFTTLTARSSWEDGIQTFYMKGGNSDLGCYANIYLPRGLLATVPVRMLDADGDFLVTMDADYDSTLHNDYNGDGVINYNDITLFSGHLGHSCTPLPDCELLGFDFAFIPESMPEAGDEIELRLNLSNNNPSHACRIEIVEFYATPFESGSNDIEPIETLTPDTLVESGQVYSVSVPYTILDEDGRCLYAEVTTGCCPDPIIGDRCFQQHQPCKVDSNVCYEMIIQLDSVPIQSIEYYVSEAPDWTVTVGSLPSSYPVYSPVSIDVQICTADLNHIGDSSAVVIYAYYDELKTQFSEFESRVVFTSRTGDVNNDCFINVGDAVFLINYIFKNGPPPVPLEAGDVNCDEAINVGDAVSVINYIFKNGRQPCLVE
ncbi:MAG: hypothetical protein GY841_05205 [FCB group bacterium]|nr:hypothetical protein [FCB group bacterium]